MPKRKLNKRLTLEFPEWVPFIYGTACAFLIPWTIFLGFVLPRQYISHNWDVAWVGFDILELILFALTAVLAINKSIWSGLSSAMLFIVLLVDAWFDVLTARPGLSESRSILEALIVELPLALISLTLSIQVFRKIQRQ